jgi:hypothetical protein
MKTTQHGRTHVVRSVSFPPDWPAKLKGIGAKRATGFSQIIRDALLLAYPKEIGGDK